jgi:hypothetical protein
MSYSLAAVSSSDGGYAVHGSLVLPESIASAGPSGGIRLRVRAPLAHTGKLSKVTIGGQPWSAFDAAEETIDIGSAKLKAGKWDIVAEFS